MLLCINSRATAFATPILPLTHQLSTPVPSRSLPVSPPSNSIQRPYFFVSARLRRPENVPGNFFVDDTCIDCDTCRWMSPTIFSRLSSQSIVHKQPRADSEAIAVVRAALACPTGSIRSEQSPPSAISSAALDSLPIPATTNTGTPLRTDDDSHPVRDPVPGVYYNGFTSRQTFGAASWLALSKDCNVLVDCPRFHEGLATRIEQVTAPRGVDYIVLTHADDVHGHARWAKRLGAQRVIHSAEVNRAQDTHECELQLGDGDFPYRLHGDEVTLHHVPGHTRGSMVVLHAASRSLFSGDHVYASAQSRGEPGRLTASTRYCFFSFSRQIESLAALADLEFLHVFPGHGRAYHFTDGDARRAEIAEAVERLCSQLY